MKKMKKLIIILILAIFVGFATFTSCNKEAPILPPENAMIMNNMDTSSQKSVTGDVSNWFTAAADVTIWTTIVKVGLAVPTIAYAEALKQTPRHLSGDKWVWQYSVTILLTKFNVQLFGEFNKSDGVDWEMYVSQVGGYQDFLWFTGTQNADGTEGQWILYESPTKNHQLLQIDWTHDYTNETGTIKYTNIVPDGPENGGYIAHGTNQTGAYDTYYDIYNKGANNLTEIDINSVLFNGRIKDSKVFGDELWHCWDEVLVNTDCPTK